MRKKLLGLFVILALLVLCGCSTTAEKSNDASATISVTTASAVILTMADGKYVGEVSNEIQAVTISAITKHKKASASGDKGKQTLKVGDNPFAVKVTAENGETKTYYIVIKRKEIGVKSITLNTTAKAIKVDEEIFVTASVTMDSETATKAAVTFSSSDLSVATISTGGAVKGLKIGKTTITAIAGDKTTTAVITVIDAVLAETVQLTVDLYYQTGTTREPLFSKYDYAVAAVLTDSRIVETDNKETSYKEGKNIIGYGYDDNKNIISGTNVNKKTITIPYVSPNAKYLRIAVPRNGIDKVYIPLAKYNLAGNVGKTVVIDNVVLNSGDSYSLTVNSTREDFIIAGYDENRANGINNIFITGPFNSWNTKDSNYKMVEDVATGIYTFKFTGLGATEKFEYKLVNEGSWANGGGMPEILADNFGADGIFWDAATERHYNSDGIWSNAGGSNGFATIMATNKPIILVPDISGFTPQEVVNDTETTHAVTVKMPYLVLTDDIAFNQTKVVAEYTYLDGTPVPMVNVTTKENLASNKITYVYDKSNANWKTGILTNGTVFVASKIAFAKLPSGVESRLIEVKISATDKNNITGTKIFTINQVQTNSVILGDVADVVLEYGQFTGEYSKVLNLYATGEFVGVQKYIWTVKKDEVQVGQTIETTRPEYLLTLNDRNNYVFGKYSVKVELVVGGIITLADKKSFNVVKTARLSSKPSAGVTLGGIDVLTAEPQGGEAVELNSGEKASYDWTIYKEGITFAAITTAVNNVSVTFSAIGDYKYDVVINALDSLDKIIRPLYVSTVPGVVKVRATAGELDVKFDIPPSVQFIVRDEFGVFDSNTPRDINANMTQAWNTNVWEKEYIATGTHMIYKFTQGNSWNPVINGRVGSQYGVMYEPHEPIDDGSLAAWDMGTDTLINVDIYPANQSDVFGIYLNPAKPLNWEEKPYKYGILNNVGDEIYGHIDVGAPSKGGANSGRTTVTPGYKYKITLDLDSKVWKIKLISTPDIVANFNIVQNDVAVQEDASMRVTVGVGSVVIVSSTAIIADIVSAGAISYTWTIKNIQDNSTMKIVKDASGASVTFAAITAGVFEVKLEMIYGGVVESTKIKNINIGIPVLREQIRNPLDYTKLIDKPIYFKKPVNLSVITSAAFSGFDAYKWNVISPTGSTEYLGNSPKVVWTPQEIGDYTVNVKGVSNGSIIATSEFTLSVGVTYDFICNTINSSGRAIFDIAKGERLTFAIVGDNGYFDTYKWVVYDYDRTPIETIQNTVTSSGIWTPYNTIVGVDSDYALDYMLRLIVTKDGVEYATDWDDANRYFVLKLAAVRDVKYPKPGDTVKPTLTLDDGITFDSAEIFIYKVLAEPQIGWVKITKGDLVYSANAAISGTMISGSWITSDLGEFVAVFRLKKGSETYESAISGRMIYKVVL